MARKGTLLLACAALLAFGVLSLVLTNSELSALDRGTLRRAATHSQVVAEWRSEDRDLKVARQNRPAAAAAALPQGLNVGRVLAKYDKDESDVGRDEDKVPPSIDRLSPRPRAEDRIMYERNLGMQLNWTARLISSSSHYGDVRERLESLGRLKNRELRMDTATRELWLYLRDQLRATNLTKTETSAKLLQSVREQLDLLSLHTSDARDASDSFIREGWRDKLAAEMTQLMQKRLHHLQNPENCEEAKKLQCRISKPCGFGCQIHHVAYCFIFAYATERMLVLDASNWRYSGKWEAVFQPLSTSKCTKADDAAAQPWTAYNLAQPPKVLSVPSVESIGGSNKPAFLPMAVPADLIERLRAFHGHPFVWFVGQFLQYLMRPSQQLDEYLQGRRKHLNISHPTVGVHIRRTDKLQQEASYHSVQEYMTQVEEWYDRRETIYGKSEERRVYLATDDKSALSEATSGYPKYTFVSDNDVSKTAGELQSRYSEKGLHGVVLDVLMLSECDYIVCTLSSQVCRLAYELMQTHHTDGSRLVYSLDDVYYFGGQQEHLLSAFHGRTERGGGGMDFARGDLIKIAGNHLNGFSLGNKQRSSQRSLFPSYKAEEEIRVANFPTYPEVL